MKNSRYDECDECGDKGNEVQLEFFTDKLLCADCWRDGEFARELTCSVCDEVREDVSPREQFNDQKMCDFCWGEECGNALKSEFNETSRP